MTTSTATGYRADRLPVTGRQIAIVLGVGLLLRLLALLATGPWDAEAYAARFNFSDQKSYYTLAANIASVGEYSLTESAPYYPDNFITPGYPYFLGTVFALTGGPAFLPIALVQIVLSLLTAIVAMYCASELAALLGAGGRSAPLIAGLLFVLEPIIVTLTVLTMTETLFLLVLLYAILLTLRQIGQPGSIWRWAVLGAVIGIGILVRPALIPSAGTFALAFLITGWKRKQLGRYAIGIGVMAVAAIVAVLPWMIRNNNVFGKFGLNTNGGITYFVSDVAAVESQLYGMSESQARDSLLKTMHGQKGRMTFEDAEGYSRAVMEKFKQHPGLFIKVHLVGCVKALIQPGTRAVTDIVGVAVKEKGSKADISASQYTQKSWVPMAYWGYWALYSLLLYGGLLYLLVGVKGAWKNPAVIFPILLMLFNTATIGALDGGPRYRLPGLVALMPLAGLGLSIVWERVRRRKAPATDSVVLNA